MTETDATDPFLHLHDEDYLAAYEQPRLDFQQSVAMGGRQRESLAGAWRFTLDLFDEGLRQKWFRDEPAEPRTWALPRDYDAGAGATIAVPSCWNLQQPQWTYFEGGAWYTREIDGRVDSDRPRCVLRVGAASYQARVFLNGRFIGSHQGASTPFFVELTPHLRAGANRLQLHVDNRRTRARVPMNHIDWFNYGGIYREVDLLRLPRVFIRDACVQLAPDGTLGRLAFDLQLSDPVDGLAHIEIDGLNICRSVQVRQGRASAVFDSRPALWSPGNPRRYLVRFRFGDDVVTESIGFREIRTEGEQLLLNGNPVYLKGICVHEDDMALGKLSSPADVRRRLSDAKELGCNFIRLAHYPHHEHVAQIADAVGMLLWEEIPVYWAIDFGNPCTHADASNQLQELIRRDRNRASVILWGIGNENHDSDARYHFMRDLAATARALDPTRLVGAACLINRASLRIEDRLIDHIDVVGLNEYFGWYEPDIDGLTRLLAASRPGKPLIISETGADALAGKHGADSELFTEECQARVYSGQIARLRGVPYICGMTPWLLYDFRSPRRQTVFNQGLNRKGLIAEDKKTRKKAFYVLADYYHSIAPELGGVKIARAVRPVAVCLSVRRSGTGSRAVP